MQTAEREAAVLCDLLKGLVAGFQMDTDTRGEGAAGGGGDGAALCMPRRGGPPRARGRQLGSQTCNADGLILHPASLHRLAILSSQPNTGVRKALTNRHVMFD